MTRQIARAEEPINLEISRLADKEGLSSIAPDKEFFVKYFSDRDRLQDSGLSRPRRRRGRGGEEEKDADDSDEAMDEFADQLAEKMLKEGGDVDVDVDDEDEDEELWGLDEEEVNKDESEEDLEEMDERSAKDKKKRKKKPIGSTSAIDFEDFHREVEEEAGDDESDDEMGIGMEDLEEEASDDEDDGSDVILQAYGDSVMETKPAGQKKRNLAESALDVRKAKKGSTGKEKKKKQKQAEDGMDGLAAAEDYENEMESILQDLKAYHEGSDGAGGDDDDDDDEHVEGRAAARKLKRGAAKQLGKKRKIK